MTDKTEGVRARDLFWRRLAAGGLDIALLVAAASLAAVLLYGASDGRLRSSTLFKTTACQPVSGISVKLLAGVAIPRGARPVAARICTTSLAGAETARYATILLQAQDGEVTRSLAFSRPVDRKGEPLRPLILDWVYPLAFILVMALCESLFGATLGKRAFGLKVAAADGQAGLGLGRALLRNIVLYGGAALVIVAPLAITVAGVRLPPLAYYGAVGLFGLLVLAPFAMFAEASPQARYDRWAGAQVIRA
jgi:uncharacterized RDD family membrane protein YckC